MRYESRFNSPTQTGIECQQDTLSGDDKSYPRTSGMSVIAVLVLGSIGLAEKAGHGVETKGTPVVSAFTGSGPLLAEQTHLHTSSPGLFSPNSRIWTHMDCRLIPYTSS
jgi:hypothetical protein